MIGRTEERFGLKPERLAADTAYGSAATLHWIVNEKKITPHIPVIDKSKREDGSALPAPRRPRLARAVRWRGIDLRRKRGRSNFRGKQDMTSVTDSDGVAIATAAADAEALLTSVFNNVALAGNNISLEMLQLATEVYGPDRADFLSHDPLVFENPSGNTTGAKVWIAPQARGWHPVTASELPGMVQEKNGSDPLKYSFVGGQYQAIDTSKSVPITGDFAEANALVITGLVHDAVSGTDKRTLTLVIRGTDQVADAYFDYQDFQTHYEKFAPLVDALHTYLADPASGIQQVLISGHSLGAGVVPYFMQAFQDTANYTVRGYVDGPPGSEADAGDSRIVNFVHAGMIFPADDDHRGDAVVIVGEVSHNDDTNTGGVAGTILVEGIMDALAGSGGIAPKTRVGSDILIDSDVPQALT